MSRKWIPFTERLPTAEDANDSGQVYLAETNGERRFGLWDWIPPSLPNAAGWWRANGFTAWMRIQ